MKLTDDLWSIENMGLPDNLMLIAPTKNIIFDSFEAAILNLSKIMK